MMARNWTKDQHAAIYARESDVLVAAAAGSGKTAVLVERIIERITDEKHPIDLDRLLVVTFTNAAAAEMRQRIISALTQRIELNPENKNLRRQLALLPKASITTIHSFCLRVLRSNFNLLGLDPGFRLAETTENELLRLSALEEVMEEMYEDPIYSDDFLKLTEAYLNIKNQDNFYILINQIYDFSMSLPNPELWLYQAASAFNCSDVTSIDEITFGKVILRAGKDVLRSIIDKYNLMIQMSMDDCDSDEMTALLIDEKKLFSAFLDADTYSALYSGIHDFSFRTVPRVKKGESPRNREDIRRIRDDIKKSEMEKLKGDLFLFTDQEQVDILSKLFPLMQCLSELVRRLTVRFDEKKDAKNLLNYNDLEHGCYKLLVNEDGTPTELAETLKGQYDEILIDEYQDTSALQEAIFSSIKNEKGTFLVGDVKQSIYRFRNTNPELFREKKERYFEDENATERKIILSKNFRSKSHVLESINFIFSRIMSEGAGEIDYNEEEMLYPGAEYPEMKRPIPKDTEICIVDMDSEESETEDESEDSAELETVEAEAIITAKKITALIENQYEVSGKNGVRPIRYRDICVLMRSTKHSADIFAKILTDYGIPCYSDAGSSFLQSEEIITMMSLLKIIDNPHQDIPLLSVLRSQLYAFTTDELAEIRLAKKYSDYYDAIIERALIKDGLGNKLKDFLERLNVFREKSRLLNTAELIWYLYMETGFYEAQATLPGGNLRRMNLRLLYTRASSYEKTGLKGLYMFINFIDKYQSTGGDYDAARNLGEEQDVVRIMSIHKSKGLEFPVVILAGIGKRFNTEEFKRKVFFHSQLGYGPQYIDTDFGITYHNVARAAVKHVLHAENLSEELRILYVALTRAREKLIMVGSCRNIARQVHKCCIGINKAKIPHFNILKGNSYLYWLLMALLPHKDGKPLRDLGELQTGVLPDSYGDFSIEIFHTDLLSYEGGAEHDTAINDELSLDILPSVAIENKLYPYSTLPGKVTVSEIKRKYMDDSDDSVYLYPRPSFLKEHTKKLTSAEYGTSMHTVLEHLDYANCLSLDDINFQIEKLYQKNLLSEEEKSCISADKILTFMNSEIGFKLKNSKKVLREVSFGLTVDAAPLFHQNGQVMMQGMIDCVIFEPSGISIVDYKTDRGESPKEIINKYKIQLDCYSEAAEKIFSEKVLHKYLYLFSFDTWIEV